MSMKNSIGFITVFLLMAALAACSIFFLLLAVNAYHQGFKETALYYSMAGLMGLIMSTYTLLRIVRRRPTVSTTLNYEVQTLLRCLKCGFSNTRGFADGDYVLGLGDKCPHCSTPMVILAIYRTPSKKEKQ